MTKYVYLFEEGNKDMKEILGGKGANLAEMTNMGIPIPSGFTITTEACRFFSEHKGKYPEGMIETVKGCLNKIEEKVGKKFGDKEDPLLFSVRSGAAVSMPGMMDTVLNLGLTDETTEALAKKTGNERFAYDAYRRFLQMFGDVVVGLKHHDFETALQEVKDAKGVETDVELNGDDLKEVVKKYKEVYKKANKDFPQDPFEQLMMSTNAVFGSWGNPRAVAYRKLNHIKGLIGTAVNAQVMVFGNMGDTSGTGVAFTRNPSTGENKFYGEYLINAQGEDVVAGTRTPEPISRLEKEMPEQYKELVKIYKKLEHHYKDIQDIEFTVQEGKLFMLQTRSGKRTAAAAVKIAIDMLQEGLIDEKTAVLRVEPEQLDQLLHKQLDPKAKDTAVLLGKGLPASPGAAVGQVVFTADRAVEMKEAGEKVILVRTETSPEDIMGMDAAQGIFTSRGGMTSHAAVVARGMGKCCVAGCGEAIISEKEKSLKIGGKEFTEGDFITLEGTAGEVFEGQLATIDPELSGDFSKLMELADKYRKLGVRTNADTPKDAEKAIEFGAEGIGLCRTEHMFFEGDRIKAVREMILSGTLEGRKEALAKLLPYQKKDFKGLFEVMGEKPVTIRLLDPPLHEFLPHEEKEQKEIADDMGVTLEVIKQKMLELHEFNPMLGHRGCRLGITYPEISEMQARAIIQAAIEVKKEKSLDVVPEIMVPLIGTVGELENQADVIRKVAEEEIAKADIELKYLVGTMIEVPRAAITAEEIGKVAEFFSFGTNDLTQMGCGFSRDDAGKFLKEFVDKGIYDKDPFQVLDQKGIGRLVELAVEGGRKAKPDIKLGICGEHGGEPSSVEFCHRIGLDYVSCSPFRVPIAKLAAAQAVLKEK
jgi:pyruvate, orthophosphate dikinase